MNAFDKEDRLLIGEMRKDITSNTVGEQLKNITMGKAKSQRKKDKNKDKGIVKKEVRRGTL